MSDKRHRSKRERRAAEDAAVEATIAESKQRARRRRVAEDADRLELAELQRRAEHVKDPSARALARVQLARRLVRDEEARVVAKRAIAAERAEQALRELRTPDAIAERKAVRAAEEQAGLPAAYDKLDEARQEVARAEAERRSVARAELERLRAEHEPEHAAAVARAVAAVDELEAALAEIAEVGQRFRDEAYKPADVVGARVEMGAGPPDEATLLRLRHWASAARRSP